MPTTHLIFDAQQRPFMLPPTEGDDDTSYSCNYISMTDGVSSTWLDEVAQKLHDAGIGTINTDIFLGYQRTAPPGDGPHIRLIATSGLAPDIAYNSSSIIDKPGLQVVVTGIDSAAVESKAVAIYNNLIASVNVSLSP